MSWGTSASRTEALPVWETRFPASWVLQIHLGLVEAAVNSSAPVMPPLGLGMTRST